MTAFWVFLGLSCALLFSWLGVKRFWAEVPVSPEREEERRISLLLDEAAQRQREK